MATLNFFYKKYFDEITSPNNQKYLYDELAFLHAIVSKLGASKNNVLNLYKNGYKL